MVLKLVLKFVVIFSLINCIQCVCRGSQAIVDAIGALSDRIEAVEKKVNILISTTAGKTCKEVRDNGISTSGVYTINPDGGTAFKVYCDMETDGGGWTVFQRRQDGSVDFYRDWTDYAEGFGDLEGEFWLGLDKIHRLTSAFTSNTLRVDLKDFDDATRYAKYSTFDIKGSDENYKLLVGGYSGDAGDSLAFHNNKPFSTKDRDNDLISENCAVRFKGAWWYKAGCHQSNLNGEYLRGEHTSHGSGVIWYHWRGYRYSLAMTEMKVRHD